MSQGSRSRSNRMLYILTGLFGGIVIGFGTALMIQNRSFTEVIPGFRHELDSMAFEGSRDDEPYSEKQGKTAKPVDPSGLPSDGEIATGDTSDVPVTIEDTMIVYRDPGHDAVLRDELVAVKRIKVTGETNVSEDGRETDSLIQSLTAVKPSIVTPLDYQVEFWQNPLNYKGYKIIKEKIIVFGLPHDHPYQLKLVKGKLYLQDKNIWYHLRETRDFLPLTPTKAPSQP